MEEPRALYLPFTTYTELRSFGKPFIQAVPEVWEVQPVEKRGEFTIGKFTRKPSEWLLYHERSLKTICWGKKRDMRLLADSLASYEFDGVDTWIKLGDSSRSVIRSLGTLQTSLDQ